MPSIVTITLSPAVDVSVSVDHVNPDSKLRTGPPQRDPGGGGLNVARAIRKLGGEALALWTCGGLPGAMLGELLDREGLVHEPIAIESVTRENFTVYEESSNRQFRFTMPGAPLTAEEADRFADRVAQCADADYLVLSGSLPPGVGEGYYARLIQAVPQGTRVVLDTSGEPLRRAVEAGVFLVKPNFRELGQLVEGPVEDDAEVDEVSSRIVQAGRAEAVVTSLGAGGAVLVSADGADPVRAPTVKIRSRVGAGDSMVAGLVLALARGEPLGRAVRFGVAAGAAAVMTDGTELCRREDTERLYEQLLERP